MTRTYSERESLFSQQEVQRWSSLQGCDSMAQVASSSGRAKHFLALSQRRKGSSSSILEGERNLSPKPMTDTPLAITSSGCS